MQKIKVLSVFGTRPEATKMVPLILAMQQCEAITSIVCVTAQHRELLDQVLVPFDIKPQYDLNLMKERQTLSEFFSRALTGLEDVFRQASPDLVLVVGDTATVFATSLAAFYAKVSVGHVEAGLRTYDKYRPFPEEINRKLVTVLADLHFAPTKDAREHLLRENIDPSAIYVTGNTAVDLISHTIDPDYHFECDVLNGIDFTRRVIVMTAHRRESFGEAIRAIDRAALRLAQAFPDIIVVYPVHPNPEVRKPAYAILDGHENILLTEPLSTHDMHNLMAKCYAIMTDSGALQEEAPVLHKPVAVMRDVTERPEGLAAGVLVLAGVEEEGIYRTMSELLTDEALYRRMANAQNPFGDGHASERIVQAILYAHGLAAERPTEFSLNEKKYCLGNKNL